MTELVSSAAKLLESLERGIEDIESLQYLIKNFYDDGKGGAQNKMNELVHSLQESIFSINRERDCLKEQGPNGMVPIELLYHMDRVEQCNPELYTKHKVEFVLEEKLRAKRIHDDYNILREELLKQAKIHGINLQK